MIRAIRAKLNLTQEQLAERLGVSFATVNRWEGGSKPQRAQAEAIAALAAEVGVTDETASATYPHRARAMGSQAPTTKPMEQMLWMPPVPFAGKKTQPSSRITCCRFSFSSACPMCSTMKSTVWRKNMATATQPCKSRRRPFSFALLPAARSALGRDQWARDVRLAARRGPARYRRAFDQSRPRRSQTKPVPFRCYRRGGFRRRTQW